MASNFEKLIKELFNDYREWHTFVYGIMRVFKIIDEDSLPWDVQRDINDNRAYYYTGQFTAIFVPALLFSIGMAYSFGVVAGMESFATAFIAILAWSRRKTIKMVVGRVLRR